MKVLCSLLSGLLFFSWVTTCSAAEEMDDLWGFDFALAMKGNNIRTSPRDERDEFHGQQFPISIGYVSFYPDRTVKFTKTTHYSIPRVMRLFQRIEQDGYLTANPYLYFDKNKIPPSDPRFIKALFRTLEDIDVDRIALHYNGEGKDYTYTFKETCIYDKNDFNSCRQFTEILGRLGVAHKKQ